MENHASTALMKLEAWDFDLTLQELREIRALVASDRVQRETREDRAVKDQIRTVAAKLRGGISVHSDDIMLLDVWASEQMDRKMPQLGGKKS